MEEKCQKIYDSPVIYAQCVLDDIRDKCINTYLSDPMFACARKFEKKKNITSKLITTQPEQPSSAEHPKSASKTDSVIIESVEEDHDFNSFIEKQKFKGDTADGAAPVDGLFFTNPGSIQSSEAGTSTSSIRGSYGKKLRRYKYKQHRKRMNFEKKRRILEWKIQSDAYCQVVKDFVKVQKRMSKREANQKAETRERLRKICVRLKEDVVPRSSYEIPDEDSVPIGMTIDCD